MTGEGTGQGFAIDPNGNFAYWAERDQTASPPDDDSNVVKSTFNKTPNGVSTAFEDAIVALPSVLFHLPMREKTDVTLADVIGSHDGTLETTKDLTKRGDMMCWTTNASGKGVETQGADYISIPDEAELSQSTNFTIGLFALTRRALLNTLVMVKGTTVASADDYRNFAIYGNFGADGFWTFDIEDSSGADKTATSTTAHAESVPHFIVGVYDSDNDEMRIYIDGVLEDTTDTTGFTPNTNEREVAFAAKSGGADPHDTVIAEPFMTASALTDAQVLALWTASQIDTSAGGGAGSDTPGQFWDYPFAQKDIIETWGPEQEEKQKKRTNKNRRRRK